MLKMYLNIFSFKYLFRIVEKSAKTAKKLHCAVSSKNNLKHSKIVS